MSGPSSGGVFSLLEGEESDPDASAVLRENERLPITGDSIRGTIGGLRVAWGERACCRL